MPKCRPGRHDAVCGPAPKGPYSDEYCNCGCSASGWCQAQGAPTINKRNYQKHAERLWALFLASITRLLDADEAVEYSDLKYAMASYLKSTTRG